QRHLLQGLFLGFAQLYNTLHLDSGAMGSPKLTKFKRVYQQHLTARKFIQQTFALRLICG
ncbi:hypothetical protein, partial [Paraburkholderia sp. 31.1]|uniref:hypothetical protein n=1 Tax=Paraburkholderia sp. 31.1 TaxID=2615205 RepID=UPI001CA4558A